MQLESQVHVRAEKGGDDVGVSFQVSFRGHKLGRHELPTRPQVPFVQDHLRIRFLNQPSPPGFRDPGAIDLAQFEQREDLRVRRVDDVDVSALIERPVPPHQQVVFERDILGVPPLGRREFFSAEIHVRSHAQGRLSDEQCSAARRPGDHSEDVRCDRKSVQGGRRADEHDVDMVGQERLDGRRPRIECLRLDRKIDSQPLVEGTLIRAGGDAIDGLCVGHVWEETEAQRGGRGSRREVAEEDGPGEQDRSDGHRREGEVRAEMSHEAVKPPFLI